MTLSTAHLQSIPIQRAWHTPSSQACTAATVVNPLTLCVQYGRWRRTGLPSWVSFRRWLRTHASAISASPVALLSLSHPSLSQVTPLPPSSPLSLPSLPPSSRRAFLVTITILPAASPPPSRRLRCISPCTSSRFCCLFTSLQHHHVETILLIEYMRFFIYGRLAASVSG